MKGCRPLTHDEVRLVKTLFTGKLKKRNLALFIFGCNTGFRISELLAITLDDVLEESGKIKTHITVARKNMKKVGEKTSGRTVLLNAAARNILVPWLKQMAGAMCDNKADFLFQSLSPKNSAITRKHALRVLKKVFDAAGIVGKTGTHTMRKTFADRIYNHFLRMAAAGEQVEPIRATAKALGHAPITTTDQYLSFRNEDVEIAINSIEI